MEYNNFNGIVHYWKVERFIYRGTTEDSQRVQDFSIDSGESRLVDYRDSPLSEDSQVI